jgi:hypothetical protein
MQDRYDAGPVTIESSTLRPPRMHLKARADQAFRVCFAAISQVMPETILVRPAGLRCSKPIVPMPRYDAFRFLGKLLRSAGSAIATTQAAASFGAYLLSSAALPWPPDFLTRTPHHPSGWLAPKPLLLLLAYFPKRLQACMPILMAAIGARPIRHHKASATAPHRLWRSYGPGK